VSKGVNCTCQKALKASKLIDAFCCILMVDSARWRCAPWSCKGMVSNQTERLSIPESRVKSSSTERHGSQALKCKYRSTERAFLKQEAERSAREWHERTTALWSVVSGTLVECATV